MRPVARRYLPDYSIDFIKERARWSHNYPNNARKPKLIEQIKLACLRRHYSPRTVKSDRYWCRQYILFHRKRYPGELNKQHIEQFLNHLVSRCHVSANTHSQALNALIFMYKHVLETDPCMIENLVRPKRNQPIPMILSIDEVRAVLDHMTGAEKFMAEVIYGSVLRVDECTQLRIKDVDFGMNTIVVRNGKGAEDRTTLLPERLIISLQQHLTRVMAHHKADCLGGTGHVPLYRAHFIKNPKAACSIGWQDVFPSSVIRVWPRMGQKVRWHCSASTPQRAFREAVQQAGIHKHVSIHTLLHCFATHLLTSGTDIRTIQTLLWHKDLSKQQQFYTHIIKAEENTPSPLDRL